MYEVDYPLLMWVLRYFIPLNLLEIIFNYSSDEKKKKSRKLSAD